MTWRRILLMTSVILAVLIALSWIVLQRTGAVAAFTTTALRSALAAPFQLGGAELDLANGTLALREFALLHPDQPGQRLLAVEQVRLAVTADPPAALLALHSIDIEGADLQLDLVAGLPPLDRLLTRRDSATGPRSPTIVPVVTARRCKAAIRISAELPTLIVEDLELRVRPRVDDDGNVDRDHAEVQGTARLATFGLPLTFAGQVDLDAGTARVQVALRDATIDDRLLDSLRPALPAALTDAALRARIDELAAWCEIRGLGQGQRPTIAFGADGQLRDLECRGRAIPYPLRGAALQFAATDADGGRLRAVLRQPHGDSAVTATAQLTGLFTSPRLEVRGDGKALRIDDEVRVALQSFAVGRAIVDGLRPTAGLADLQLFLANPGQDDEVVELDLDLQGVALSYHGFGSPARRVAFPLPVVGARGRVQVRGDVIHITDVTAQIAADAGGGQVVMSGRVHSLEDLDDLVAIDLDARDLQLGPGLRSALGHLLRDDGALWDQFDPQGRADVTLKVRAGEGRASDWNVQVMPRDATVRWTRFPWQLQQVQGAISAHDLGLEFDLRGAHGGATLTAHGRLLAPADRPGALTAGRVELHAEAAGVPLDGDLRLATTTLLPGLDRVWEDLQPAGTTGASVTVHRANGNADLTWDLRLDIERATATAAFLPLPVHDLHGPVFVTPADGSVRIDVEALRGRVPQGEHQAELALVGSVWSEPRREDLTAVVRNLRLDGELADALDRAGALSAATWQTLQPSGTVDVTCHHLRTGDQPAGQRLTVFLRDVASDARMLPRRATQVTGELDIQNGVVTFEHLRARVGDAPVRCVRGHVRPLADGATEIAFTIAADHFPANDDLARLFNGPLHQAVLDRQLRGTLRIHELDLRFLLPATGAEQPFATTLRGRLEVADIEVLLGTRLESMSALVEIEDSTIDARGGALRGSVTRGSLRLLGHPCNALQARFVADAERITLSELRGELHGGSIAAHAYELPALEYRMASAAEPDGHLALDLDFERVRLQDFLTACGLVGTPYRGAAAGRFQLLSLRGNDLVNMHAAGNVAVTDGDLGTVPLFTAIYALMAESNRPRFEGLSSRFTLQDRVLRLDDVAVSSPLIAVTGSGTMTMEGYLDVAVTLDSLFGGSGDLLLLPPVIQMITSRLVRFHLFGHLRDLRAEQRWFAESDPRRTALTPLPLRTERPVRPGF
ncbi:MAG: hypothetical protein IPK26_24435 [Planctomycetes bacterium]|nr:hypothetical protein [Planctomycetota bacterium]